MHSKQSSIHNPFPQDRTDSQHAPVDLYPGQHLHGFEVRAVTPIDELRAVAIELAHQHSGARLLHLYLDDSRNWFSISPMTPAPDDTGVQHVLEHSVMMGSRNYPVKEVWFEMMKMSLAGFDSANAMNWVDHAFYYTSSNLEKDLFNLIEVYFDSVFNPLLTEETFKREGHHLEPVDPSDPAGAFRINGIVYNEVKIGSSDPRECFHSVVTRALLPDTCYTHNSAGDSLVLPDLTFEQLKSYHKSYYHPSNSYFFFYGNIPTRDYLAFLEDKLGAVANTETCRRLHTLRPEITHQPKWKAPQTVRETYPIGTDEPLDKKTHLMLSWLIGDATDPEDTVLCRILSLILLGNEGSPLRKAIMDSKLGTDLFDGDFLDGLTGPNWSFHVGLIGSEADRVGAFTELIVNTLTEIADSDIDTETVEAAFQQLAFEYKEITPRFPFQMMKRVINTWIYERAPTLFLKMGACLSTIRQRWNKNPRVFNELIREKLLDNPHRLTTVLSPDSGMHARMDDNENVRLLKIRAQLTDEQIRKIAADASELERLNGQPNSPADLAKLPQLRVSDLPEKPLHTPTSVETVCGRPLIRSDIFSNGVSYLELSFDLQGLPQNLWQYLPRYTNAIGKLGAGSMNYAQAAHRVASVTGGVECFATFGTHALDPSCPVWNVQLRLKALDDKLEEALGVLHDLVFYVNPRDEERLYDVLSQAVSEYRTHIHGYRSPNIANRRAARGFTPERYLSEIVFGLSQLRTSEMLFGRFDEIHEELVNYIEQIRDFLLVRGRIVASFCGSDKAFRTCQGYLAKWIGDMCDELITPTSTGFEPFDKYPREALAAPVQVGYCTQVIPAPHYSHPDSILLTIGSHILLYDYILPEIRLKGNAYSAGITYNPFDAVLYQDSHFDPHVARTLDVFAHTVDYVKQVKWTQTDIDRAIIGTTRYYQKTIRPSQASTEGLAYFLAGQSREIIEEKYTRLRGATPKEVKRALLQVFEENRDKASICVVASREKLESENRKMAHPLSIENIFE